MPTPQRPSEQVRRVTDGAAARARPPSIPPTGGTSLWTEQLALRRLRRRYQRDGDLFSRGERSRLAFVRWLSQTGRIRP
jgi:hypothetical protein